MQYKLVEDVFFARESESHWSYKFPYTPLSNFSVVAYPRNPPFPFISILSSPLVPQALLFLAYFPGSPRFRVDLFYKWSLWVLARIEITADTLTKFPRGPTVISIWIRPCCAAASHSD